MNSDTLAGQWKQLKGSAKVKWGRLTDDDLTRAEGNYDKLVGAIQERYGYARERAEEEVREWYPAGGDTNWERRDHTQP
jgi:uncharacterized protein YjbJ (UPF0337 family)